MGVFQMLFAGSSGHSPICGPSPWEEGAAVVGGIVAVAEASINDVSPGAVTQAASRPIARMVRRRGGSFMVVIIADSVAGKM
jgi:hypothetical protein